MAAWFQSVVTRTAGFNSIAIGACRPSALFVMIVLMFIGAAPGSTGGGVKVSTVGVILAALWATARGESDVVIFKRRLPPEQIARAFLICLVAFLAVNALAAVLLAREGRRAAADAVRGRVGVRHGRHVHRRRRRVPLSLSGHFSVPGRLLISADDVCRPHRSR